MTTPADETWPALGMIGLTTIRGLLGWLVAVGQLLLGDASRFTHAFVVLEDGLILEAMPRGARVVPLSTYAGRVTVFGPPAALDEVQRAAVLEAARRLVDTPYGFADYLVLALARVGFRWGWVERFASDDRRMICSQLCTAVYGAAGIALFDDARPAFLVTPGDLANRFLELGSQTAENRP